jgi:hypothetical protein
MSRALHRFALHVRTPSQVVRVRQELTRQQLGEEAKRYAGEIELRAKRKLGEMLKETERAKGATAGGKKVSPRGTYLEPRDTQPTLRELKIDKKTSAQAQKLAATFGQAQP